MLRIPGRIYKRRKVWHWLADAGAPDRLWSLFVRSKWRHCATCGRRGVGRDKHACAFGGGLSARYYCSTDHYFAREEW